MILEVKTKQDFLRAILQKADEIHVCNDKLALGIITRPMKHRLAFYAMRTNGYKLRTLRYLGRFDVRLVREASPGIIC